MFESVIDILLVIVAFTEPAMTSNIIVPIIAPETK